MNWNATIDICPDCRAGKDWIEWEHLNVIGTKIHYECTRCGYEDTKELYMK